MYLFRVQKCKFLPDRTKQKLISSLLKINMFRHISKLIPILLQLFLKCLFLYYFVLSAK